jgi:5-methylcytosine-specific restriction protein B
VELVHRWRAEGIVSLAATHLSELAAGASQQAVRTAVEAGYQYVDYAQRTALANEYHAFLSQMDPDDVIATVADDRLSVGVVTGEPEFEPADDGARLRRTVEWNIASSTAIDSLPSAVRAEFDRQGTVLDLTSELDVLTGMLKNKPAPVDDHVVLSDIQLRPVDAQLAARLHIGEAWLQELIDLLQERKQVVLYGPPGTGKTFVAQAVARHVAERDAVQLVQFHPSYSYEDFFEGFRPVEGADGSSVGFAKAAGPLRNLAAVARVNPGWPYILVVDEMNRANLAKVFGELYFLLEYRNERIQLQYSPLEAFTLPPNVLIIGTMNTADRSIAMVDAAIRRRFAFVEMHPDDAPVRDVLARWLAANGQAGDERAELLRALNEVIGEEDRDFKVGPSYLMKPNLDRPGALERVWRYDLLPLLEEHYYGRLTRPAVLDRFGLAAIRRRLAASRSVEVVAPAPVQS